MEQQQSAIDMTARDCEPSASSSIFMPSSKKRSTGSNNHIGSSSRVKDSQLSSRVKFKIGGSLSLDNPSDNLDVLQELLTHQHSPPVVPFANGCNAPTRINSTSSISSVASSGEHCNGRAIQESAPKEVLVELYDLKLRDERLVVGIWEETARWIKYEEDVEGVDHQRWGRPHVAFLSFHALIQLRKCIAKGAVLLDQPVRDFDQLSEIVATAVTEGHETVSPKTIAQILKLRHNHVRDRRLSRISTAASSLFDRGHWAHDRLQQQQHTPPPKSASAVPLNNHATAINTRSRMANEHYYRNHHRSFANSPPTIIEDDECESGESTRNSQRFFLPRSSTPNVRLDMDQLAIRVPFSTPDATTLARHQQQRQSQLNLRKGGWKSSDLANGDVVLNNLPDGTESAQVFVGEVSTMSRARFLMLRLANAPEMPEIVEHHLPIRFVFLILGPPLVDGSYHELGRSIATLMSNKHFNQIAYSARDKSQLIEGLDGFLDGSVVIPPGEVDSKRLLSGDEIRKALRRRKREMSKQKVASSSTIIPDAIGDPDLLKKVAGPKELQRASDRSVNGRQNHSNKETASGKSSDSSDGSDKKRQFPFFRGMRADIRNRLPLYWSDFQDALNFQCLTSVVFMFFASFVPAISFGGLMGKYTNEKIGTIETLFAQCICGIIWGIFSAQPLLIMSATGPVLIFEASLYTFCENLHLDFLVVRFYAGLFILIIALCTVALDGSRLLVFVTRFTEDIFATLISAIFIAESLHFVWHTFKENPVEDYRFYQEIHLNCQHKNASPQFYSVPAGLVPEPLPPTPLALPLDFENLGSRLQNETEAAGKRYADARLEMMSQLPILRQVACGDAEPNTALLTAIIVFSTFILAFLLKKLRETIYLGRPLRRALGDFGVLISIVAIAMLVHMFIPDPYLQRLDMPDHINFTNPEQRGHGLIVNPRLHPREWHGIFVAFIAALLVFILLFVETEITELLLTRKEKGCKKGSGMHWDLVLMGVCAFLCSIFGLPWMCAAAVQSLAHCSSLTVMKKAVPGARPEVDYVIEQRVSTIFVAVLVGMVAFAGSYLRLPLASLFGVFLYLGVMNLAGVQFVQRIVLFLIPEKYFPQTPYTEHVSIWRMHLYTWIQLACLFLVYAVKYFKKTALAFPFVLMLFIIFRQLILQKVFTEQELTALDGEEQSEDDEWNDGDFYANPTIPV